MIVLLEPERPAGFVSGGYRYQHEIGMRLAARGAGELRPLPAPDLARAAAALQRERPDALVVADGLFAATAPLPPGVVALLHAAPARADWCATPLPVIATAAATLRAPVVAARARSTAVVRPGLDACFVPRPAAPRRPGPLRVLCIGTVGPDKGQLLLVRTLRTAPAPCELTLLGDATVHAGHAAAVRAAAGPLPLRVRGCVPPAEVAAALHDADLLVSASRSESFGMAVAEAAACGTPVLAFAAGEIATFLVDGRNGWLLPADAGDAAFAARLGALLRQPGLLAAARTAAQRPKLDDWDRVATDFAAACARAG